MICAKCFKDKPEDGFPKRDGKPRKRCKSCKNKKAQEIIEHSYPTTHYSFKLTGVREIDRILCAVSLVEDNYEIQAAADNAAKIWKTLWANGKP